MEERKKKLQKYLVSCGKQSGSGSKRARIFPSHKCALCGESTMESRLRVSEGNLVCPECAPEEYTRGW